MFKIAFLLGTKQIGGTENQIKKLINGLKELGISVDLFILNRRPFFIQNPDRYLVFNCNLKFLYYTTYLPLLSSILFKKYLKKGNYDILAVNAFGKNIDLAIDNKKYVKNIIFMIRNIRFVHDSFFKDGINKIAKGYSNIICNSIAIRKTLNKTFDIDEKYIKVINNGIDYTKMIDVKSKKTNFIVMFVGNLREVKNPLFFLKVINQIMKTNNYNILFYIVGDGPMMLDIKQYIQSNNLGDYVKLFGNIKNNEIPYSEVNLTFNCSISEGSSNTILESLSFGIPVVASDNIGNKEILNNKSFAKLYKNESVSSAVRAIDKFYNLSIKDNSEISKDAIYFINSNYNNNLMIEEYYKYFVNISNANS